MTPQEQYTRQRISDTWQPNGFDRYAAMQVLLKEMHVLGGPTDEFGPAPRRFDPIGPLEDDFPIRSA